MLSRAVLSRLDRIKIAFFEAIDLKRIFIGIALAALAIAIIGAGAIYIMPDNWVPRTPSLAQYKALKVIALGEPLAIRVAVVCQQDSSEVQSRARAVVEMFNYSADQKRELEELMAEGAKLATAYAPPLAADICERNRELLRTTLESVEKFKSRASAE
jgi:hypothetical protein